MQKNREEPIQFKTWGFYPMALPPLAFFLILFAASIYIKHSVGMAVFGLPFLFLLLSSVANIEVRNDGIVVKRITFGSSYWSLDDARFKAGGRILAYGGMYGGWIMPLRWRGCFEAIRTSKPEDSLVRKTPSKIHPYIYLLVPPILLWISGNLLRYFELMIPPIYWASLWGIIMTLSTAMFMYSAPIKFKIATMSRLTSSIALGLIIGLMIFLSLLLVHNW